MRRSVFKLSWLVKSVTKIATVCPRTKLTINFTYKNIECRLYLQQNGCKKVEPETKMFMNPCSIRECILSLKIKNTEGFDRIPRRILVDGIEHLITAFNGLFGRIYEQVTVPSQWQVSKTILVSKTKETKNTSRTIGQNLTSVQKPQKFYCIKLVDHYYFIIVCFRTLK